MSGEHRPYPELTPIIRDMQFTAHDLGVTRDLLDVRGRCYDDMDPLSQMKLDRALEVLGVAPRPQPAADRTVPVLPDPRD
jgi:hypothetical protein